MVRTDLKIGALSQKPKNAEVDASMDVIEGLEHREYYRRLSKAADRPEHAAGGLRDIAVRSHDAWYSPARARR